MLMKTVIIMIMLIILVALGSGLVFLVRGDKNNSKRLVQSLTWRIALSISLFIFLCVAVYMHWITPHGI